MDRVNALIKYMSDDNISGSITIIFEAGVIKSINLSQDIDIHAKSKDNQEG